MDRGHLPDPSILALHIYGKLSFINHFCLMPTPFAPTNPRRFRLGPKASQLGNNPKSPAVLKDA